MNPILARHLIVITKSGRKVDYTHVTLIEAKENTLRIIGETDGNHGMRINMEDYHRIEGIEVMIVEFYKPPQ